MNFPAEIIAKKWFPLKKGCGILAVIFSPSTWKAFLAFLSQRTTLTSLNVQHHSNSSLPGLQIILVLIKLVNAITI